MMTERNHRAIVFHDLDAVPSGSSGHFSLGAHSTLAASKDKHGVWYGDGGQITPHVDWIFTSHSGPANDAALRDITRSEPQCEELGISKDDANTVVGALYEKLTDVERYLMSYRDVKQGPTPADECCDHHRLRFDARVEQRAALKAQRKQVEKLIRIFERLAS